MFECLRRQIEETRKIIERSRALSRLVQADVVRSKAIVARAQKLLDKVQVAAIMRRMAATLMKAS
jgi:hypothetical protein